MTTCDQLAAQLTLLQNQYNHVQDPDRRAEIAKEIGQVVEEIKRQRCPSQTPWAVLLCKFKDDPSESPVPNFRTVCERFFTASGADTFNVVRFFSDMSHGLLDLSGSQVFGWFTLDVNHNDGKSQGDIMVLAKQAARDASIPLDKFYGVVLIMNTPIGWAQGTPASPGDAPGPAAYIDCRRVNGFPGPPRIGEGNGTEVFGQEMGHGYGLGHSRRDGDDEDSQDMWDIMSTANAYSTTDPDYGARGPGLNAWNMRAMGWLDESRVWRGTGQPVSETVQLRPLHRHDLPGWLAAELPPNDGDGGHGRYLVEFRNKEAWDAGIPRSAVLVHRLRNPAPGSGDFPKRSYIMSGTNGNQDLVQGDVFAPGGGSGLNIRAEVLNIDETNQMATIRLSSVSLEINGPTELSIPFKALNSNPGNYSITASNLRDPLSITWQTQGRIVSQGQPTTAITFPRPGVHAGSSFDRLISVQVVDADGLTAGASLTVTITVFTEPSDPGDGGNGDPQPPPPHKPPVP